MTDNRLIVSSVSNYVQRNSDFVRSFEYKDPRNIFRKWTRIFYLTRNTTMQTTTQNKYEMSQLADNQTSKNISFILSVFSVILESVTESVVSYAILHSHVQTKLSDPSDLTSQISMQEDVPRKYFMLLLLLLLLSFE
ncbi:hypothetical protein T08_4327 [Trichinella sp. T8]|nr:hypothetical protein T08_4327 [Trichinella sp. T8]